MASGTFESDPSRAEARSMVLAAYRQQTSRRIHFFPIINYLDLLHVHYEVYKMI